MKYFDQKLNETIDRLKSSLCVGIDPNLNNFPSELIPELKKNREGTVEKFCKKIIEVTAPYCAAFKPQVAMFSSIACETALENLTSWIVKNFPNHILIIDAKRGDIGTTAQHYACEIFDRYNAHATTVNPYMGFESLSPFLSRKEKGIYVICRTSNPRADEIQNLELKNGEKLFERIAKFAMNECNFNKQVGLVVGATVIEELLNIKRICPKLPLLIPGIGKQGGSIAEVVNATKDENNVLINASRSIIFASNDDNWIDSATKEAKKLNDVINKHRSIQ